MSHREDNVSVRMHNLTKKGRGVARGQGSVAKGAWGVPVRELLLAARAAPLEDEEDVRRLGLLCAKSDTQALELPALGRCGQQLCELKVEPAGVLVQRLGAQRGAAVQVEHVDLHPHLHHLPVRCEGVAHRELAHVDADRVRLGDGRLDATQRLVGEQAHTQRRRLTAAWRLLLECDRVVDQITLLREELREVDIPLANLLRVRHGPPRATAAVGRAPTGLQYKVNVRVVRVG